jgi:hypothetical protein
MMHSHQLDESNSRNGTLGYHTVLSDPVKMFEKNPTMPTEGGAFGKSDSKNFGPLRSLSVAKKDSYPLEVNAHTLSLSVRDQIGSCFNSTPLVLSVQWELNFSKTRQKSPVHKIG